jgi:stress response protein SCP2
VAQTLVKGQNLTLDPSVGTLRVRLRWAGDGAPADLDIIALLVGPDRRVRTDDDMVFYNKTASADGAVVLAGKTVGEEFGVDELSVDLLSLPEDVDAVVVAASHEAELSTLRLLEIVVSDDDGASIAQYRVDELTAERAVVLGEVYRRHGAWRLRAIGQGWSSGLEGLATDHGITVDADAGASESADEVGELDVDEGSKAPDATQTTNEHDAPVVASPEPEDVSGEDGPQPVEPDGRARRAPIKVASKVKRATVPKPVLGDDDTWRPPRLFSVHGIGGADEQEDRATSALLWTMAAVRPFGRALTARAHGPAGKVETFLQVPFTLGDNKVIPDGMIRVARGSKLWTACLEVKTGDGVLGRPQVESYLKIAKKKGFDVVLTISNEVAVDPDVHPVELPASAFKSVRLVHISWSEVMHEIRMLLAHHPFTDPMQVWVLTELLHYLEHPRSGAMAFHDMGPNWVPVRDAVGAGRLGSADRRAVPVVESWHRLTRQLCLSLTARLGVPVKQSLPRRHLIDPALRTKDDAEGLARDGALQATFKVPGAAGPLTVHADLRTAKVVTSIDVTAPREGALPKRVGWLTRQLKDAPDDLLVEARFAPRSETTREKLPDVVAQPGVLLPGKDLEPSSFRVLATGPLGMKRSGTGGFVVSVNSAVATFYGSTVERLRPWTPPAPQLPDADAETAPLPVDPDDAATTEVADDAEPSERAG